MNNWTLLLCSCTLSEFVLSSRGATEKRQAILNSWAKDCSDCVYFLVGNYCPIPNNFQRAYTCEIKPNLKAKTEMDRYPTAEQNQTWIDYNIQLNRQLKNEKNVVFLEHITDTYRSLPTKMKYGFKFFLDHYKTHFPNIKFFVKADDDMYLRPEFINKLTQNYMTLPNPLAIGKFKNLNVARNNMYSPNYEKDYHHRKYPLFPLGSFGHIENLAWAQYVVKNIEGLFDYQGEDTSTGIWMDDSPDEFRESIRLINTEYFSNQRNCLASEDYDKAIIGHKIKPEMQMQCYKNDLKNNSNFKNKRFSIPSEDLRVLEKERNNT